jgi:ATP-dependent helicase/nuclease subunit B
MADLESRLFANSRNKADHRAAKAVNACGNAADTDVKPGETGVSAGANTGADANTLPCPITLRSAKNPVAEVRALVCEINAAIHEGLRYRDLAVITGAFDDYAPILSRELEKAGIPAFLDFRRGIMSNPVVELLRALTYIPLYGYSAKAVFRLLRCTLFETDEKETDELENYVVAMGIHGKSTWKSEWKRTWRKGHPPVIPEINRTREAVIARVLPFADILEAGTTVSAKIEALRGFLASEDIEERLGKLCEMLAGEPGNASLVSEYTQILAHIEEIFERMQGLIGDEIMPLKDFVELLELGFIETKVGILPQSMDCMLVGDVERSRIGRIKRLFFIGVNEGVIPQAASGSGIISDSDRTFFLENGFELSPTLREKAYTEEFYLYQNLTKPAESIYISYAENDATDSKLSPSYLVSMFKRMYKGFEVIPASHVEKPEYRLLSDNGRTALLETLRDLKADMLEGGAWSEGLKAKAAMLSGAVRLTKQEYEQIIASVFYKSKEQKIEEETAKRLYGDFFASVSRLEDFAGCNLAHFLKYGLDLSKRREYKIQTYDIGNLCHNIIEKCGRRVLEENRKFSALSAEDCRQLVEDAAAEEFSEYENGMMHDSKRREHIAALVKNTCLRTMLTTVHQLEGGSFEPAWLEESFAVNNGDLKLYGRFDRVDICEDNGSIYVKIVDYKSSPHVVDDEKIEAGLQLQLGIYAAAAKALVQERFPDREYVPGAVFYYTMEDPIVDECDDPEAKVNKELTPNGRVNADPAVLIRLDEGFKPDEDAKTELRAGYKTDKIPVNITAKGEFDRYSKIWSKERFDEITGFLVEKSKEYVNAINCGEASANPARYRKASVCRYCDFKDVCAFGSLSGKRERVIGKAYNDGDTDGADDGEDGEGEE